MRISTDFSMQLINPLYNTIFLALKCDNNTLVFTGCFIVSFLRLLTYHAISMTYIKWDVK